MISFPGLRKSLSSAARTVSVAAGLAVAAATLLAPSPAKAWWHGWRGGVVIVPPIVVGPPVVYAPPPVAYVPPPYYYGPPLRVWVPGHWSGPYWVPGPWA